MDRDARSSRYDLGKRVEELEEVQAAFVVEENVAIARYVGGWRETRAADSEELRS